MALIEQGNLDRLLVDVFILFFAAKVVGQLFEFARQPAAVGELIAGLLVGPAVLGWIHVGQLLEALAELGVIFLLFQVGLETRFSELRAVGRSAVTVAILGVIAPFVLGWGYMLVAGHGSVESLFVGTALVATSVGVTARVLADLGLLAEPESRIILGAAILDDILAIVILAIVSGAAAGTVSAWSVIAVIVEALAFVGFLAVIGTRIMRRYPHWLEAALPVRAPSAVALILCLGLSALAAAVGLAAIIGAFMAGMVLAEAREHYALEKRMEPVTAFLAPFFFTVTGAKVSLDALGQRSLLLTTLALTALAIVGKLIGGFVGVRDLGRRSALIVGTGMTPRGEVGLIVASLGLATGTISRNIFSIVVAVAILTTIVAPPVLVALFRPRLAARTGDAAGPGESPADAS
jgi:Kef-type K+ transport system membrane component KefB